MSLDDKKVLNIWDNSCKNVDNHYELSIPFKSDDDHMSNNFDVARSRLDSLRRKLDRGPDMFARYKAEIDSLLENGYAEKVSQEELSCPVGRIWYLPHHAVFNVNKPEKLRVVLDCAAKYMGKSLNDYVLQGPDMTNSLIGVLLRFRERHVAVMADIQAMFHQVRVTPSDKDVLRFLWWTDGDTEKEPEVYRMRVHPFGGVWSPSCANYALRKTATDNITDFTTEAIRTVLENFYVDDCLKSLDTVTETTDLIYQLRTLLTKGGFNLTKWVGSSSEVLLSVPTEHRANGVKEIDKGILPVERALGVQWDMDKDTFGFKIQQKIKPYTRRGMISIISSVYDPLGMVCPYILEAKKLFQNECRSGKKWDEPLTESVQRKWKMWMDDLPTLENMTMDRCLQPDGFGQILRCELHHFADASLEGYGTVSYLRMENAEGNVHVSFLLGKARLAPLKQLTIPRLELSAAVLAVKVDAMLLRELRIPIDDSTFWTDSTTVLHYILSTTKRYHIFVANRVAVIHDGTRPDQWRYVNSSCNPADDASRGLQADVLLSNERWLHGPDFLLKDKSEWPSMRCLFQEETEVDPEVKKEVTACSIVEQENIFNRLFSHYSSWRRLIRGVAWLLRFRKLLLEKVLNRGDKAFKWDRGNLKVSDLIEAEGQVVKVVQHHEFAEEMDALLKGRPLKKSSDIYELEPHLDASGLMCVGGRLHAAFISEESKQQRILPKAHPIVPLIVRHYHEHLGHSGKEHVLSEIRQKYWIIRGRPAVKKVIRNCVFCQKRFGKPVNQRMARLPAERVTAGKPPFTYVGVDCFGPFRVKRGRSELLRYGCIFTCMTIRAIHIEKLESMETDSFLNAFMRFQARRGRPEKVRSDNGTNFTGAEKELRKAVAEWDHDKIERTLGNLDIQWEFNPPYASHMGGVWERQIRTVRRVLTAIMRNNTLSDEELSTLLCEAECIVNSRPVTTVSDEPGDLEPLSPNHLLLLRSGSVLPYGQFGMAESYRKRWKHVQFLADQFWRRWVAEYLPTLQLRQKWFQPQRNFQEGDVVLVVNENSPRRAWPLARVTQAFSGEDGLVRSVEVRIGSTTLKRPVNKLCLLEGVSE